MVVNEIQTQLVFRSLRNTTRVNWKMPAVRVAEIESAGGTFEHVHPFVSGAAQHAAWRTSDISAGMVAAGKFWAPANHVPSRAELVARIVADAKAIIHARSGAMAA